MCTKYCSKLLKELNQNLAWFKKLRKTLLLKIFSNHSSTTSYKIIRIKVKKELKYFNQDKSILVKICLPINYIHTKASCQILIKRILQKNKQKNINVKTAVVIAREVKGGAQTRLKTGSIKTN